MLYGLGVPSLWSIWGAIRNRQSFIVRMCCKSCVSLNFSIFFHYLHVPLQNNKITRIYCKKNDSYFLKNNLHDLPQKKYKC